MRIVIVEDEKPIRDGMGKILEKINPDYRLVGSARNGKEGLKLIKETRPDLVIMDIHMPEMDGLTMLKKIRSANIDCKAIVLSAYSDFNYAKQAIELGIENYLLKPIKISELKRTLKQIEEGFSKDQESESIMQVDKVFFGSMTGLIKVDEHLDAMTREQYGFGIEDDMDVFLVWIKEDFQEQKNLVKEAVEEWNRSKKGVISYILEVANKQMLVTIIYTKRKKENREFEQFETEIVPSVCEQIKGSAACVWGRSNCLSELEQTLEKMAEELQWHLVFEKNQLITEQLINKTETVPLKYPEDLENQTKQAVMKGDMFEYEKGFRKFYSCIRQETYNPGEVKETCIRYCIAIFTIAKEIGIVKEELSVQHVLKNLADAVDWPQVNESLRDFSAYIEFRNTQTEEPAVSVMVKRAQQLIQEHYNEGITLDEIARKLFVSEEYLSTQFKKETGVTFSETIRKFRIEKVKELLLNSSLKLNQIAEMTGYADPKYMSKVFKEEVGVLPAEYRKIH